MGRPPHPVGTAGAVRTYQSASGWRARTTYRDFDGITREVQRHGRTEAAAKRALAEALRDRVYIGGGDLTGDSRVTAAIQGWLEQIKAEGRSASTVEQYARMLDKHVIPGIGQLRVRELTVGACSAFLRTVEAKHGSGAAPCWLVCTSRPTRSQPRA